MTIFIYWNVISFNDVFRIPKRFFIGFIMSNEECAKTKIKEYCKLRKFLETLDLPLKEKQSIMWDIERFEKDSVSSLSNTIMDSTLEKIKLESLEEGK